MSQEKVDLYKEEKKNRKKNLAKAKRKKKFWKVFAPILAILICGLIGCAIYFIPKLTQQQNATAQSEEIDYDQLMQMLDQYSEESATGDETSEEVIPDESTSETEETVEPSDETVIE